MYSKSYESTLVVFSIRICQELFKCIFFLGHSILVNGSCSILCNNFVDMKGSFCESFKGVLSDVNVLNFVEQRISSYPIDYYPIDG